MYNVLILIGIKDYFFIVNFDRRLIIWCYVLILIGSELFHNMY